MSAQCDAAMSEAAGGIASALKAVDCVSSEVTGTAFGKLFAPGGALATTLTILLTLYVAFFAIALLTGRSSLGIRQLMPRMLTVGLVLTFATSWVAYQSVVWNLALGAPDWLAGILTGDRGSATMTFASKVDVVFQAVERASSGQTDIELFSPPGMLWAGAFAFMLGTVGVLVTARIALALVVALGPVFVVMALFDGTRGLFTGWVKALVMLALTPLFAVIAGGIMLELSVPILSALTQNAGEIPARPAMAFLMVGCVQLALMMMVLKVAGTMVAGWQVFGMVPGKEAKGSETGAADSPQIVTVRSDPASQQASPTAVAAGGTARRTAAAAGLPYIAAANDRGAGPSSLRETRIIGTASGAGQQVPATAATSRTRGLGNRYKAAAPRSTEKVK
ncbi:type IV secretion system protein [Parerythrobacter aurantius]|uniref:type IV secretion system protein n=1 Tax=Parerythrobacter aurantius TaxID=3127706 RepID=UPI0032555FA9